MVIVSNSRDNRRHVCIEMAKIVDFSPVLEVVGCERVVVSCQNCPGLLDCSCPLSVPRWRWRGGLPRGGLRVRGITCSGRGFVVCFRSSRCFYGDISSHLRRFGTTFSRESRSPMLCEWVYPRFIVFSNSVLGGKVDDAASGRLFIVQNYKAKT